MCRNGEPSDKVTIAGDQRARECDRRTDRDFLKGQVSGRGHGRRVDQEQVSGGESACWPPPSGEPAAWMG